MRVNEAEFVLSATDLSALPSDGLPEIALAGRSNVGKSSLINRLTGRKKLARTSSVPGRTQTLNYYRINGSMYLVDCPGYGYAKVSRETRRKWGKLMERFMLERSTLNLVLLIVDVRHPPTKDDCAMYEWLAHHRIPRLVVATKADKVGKTRWPSHVAAVRKTLAMEADDRVILFSSETGTGTDELWERIGQAAERKSSGIHS